MAAFAVLLLCFLNATASIVDRTDTLLLGQIMNLEEGRKTWGVDTARIGDPFIGLMMTFHCPSKANAGIGFFLSGGRVDGGGCCPNLFALASARSFHQSKISVDSFSFASEMNLADSRLGLVDTCGINCDMASVQISWCPWPPRMGKQSISYNSPAANCTFTNPENFVESRYREFFLMRTETGNYAIVLPLAFIERSKHPFGKVTCFNAIVLRTLIQKNGTLNFSEIAKMVGIQPQTSRQTQGLRMRPTPSGAQITFDGKIEKARLMVYDISGNCVNRFSFDSGNQMDLRDLARGLYLLKIMSEEGTQVVPFPVVK